MIGSARCRSPRSTIPRSARPSGSGATNTPRRRAAPTWAYRFLSRVCSYAVEQGTLTVNPCEGIAALYSSDRAAIIWTESDIARIKAVGSSELGHAIDLATTSGLRRGDLIRVSWSHIQDDAIVITTGKSNHRREAVIPLYDELRDVLARIPQRATTILTNSKGYAWTNTGFGQMITAAKAKAGIGDLHFHDLRGTAATKFYSAGLSLRVIAEILGWTESSVDNIIRKYVDRTAATRAAIEQMRLSKQAQQQYSGNVIPIKNTAKHSPHGVYFILSGDRVKIGWSADVASRLNALQTGTADPLHVLHVIPGEQKDERRFHREFAAQHIRGEWFRLEGPLALFLAPFIGRENVG